MIQSHLRLRRGSESIFPLLLALQCAPAEDDPDQGTTPGEAPSPQTEHASGGTGFSTGGDPVVSPLEEEPPATGGVTNSSSGGSLSSDQPPSFPDDPDDHRTEMVPAGSVKLGWAFKDMGPDANYDGGERDDSCPDPDAMLTLGSVNYEAGRWTITGSGEGFIHGWDQGSLVYYEHPIEGDFTFTAQVEELAMTQGESLNGAAQALLNVRDDLGYKEPTHSLIAGAAPDKFQFMARYLWDGENKWWHWPAWPDTWPDSRPVQGWTRLVARGDAISAYYSSDGENWTEIQDNDPSREWYPFRLAGLSGSRYAGLTCSARNDRNLAPLARLPGKSVDCRDPDSPQLRAAARCVFSHVSLTLP